MDSTAGGTSLQVQLEHPEAAARCVREPEAPGPLIRNLILTGPLSDSVQTQVEKPFLENSTNDLGNVSQLCVSVYQDV